MNRKEIIEKYHKEEDVKVMDFDEIANADKTSIKQMETESESELIRVNKDIKELLKNPNYSISEDFVTLVKRKEDINNKIELLNEIKKEYV